MQTLESKRLTYEPLFVSHTEALFELFQDPEIYTWIAREPPDDLTEFREGIQFLQNRQSRDGTEYWLNWVCREKKSGSIVGKIEISLHKERKDFNLAYTVFRPFLRQGFAREACLCVMNHLRDFWGAKKALIYMDVKNEASVKLAESLGARRVDIVLQAQKIRGIWSDEYRYELDLTE